MVDNLNVLRRFHPAFHDHDLIDQAILDSLPDNGSIFDQLRLQIDDNSATHNENLGPSAAAEDDELTNLCSDGFVPNIRPNEAEHTQLQNLLCPGDVVLTMPSFQNDMPINEHNPDNPYMRLAFPTLYCTGQADFHELRPFKVTPEQYFRHLI